MGAGLKWPECEVGESRQSSAEAKNAWRYNSTNHIRVRLRGMVFN
jgi:hypothetical protein